MRQLMQIGIGLCVLFSFLVVSAAPAGAGLIEIQLTGLFVDYDSATATIVDAGASDPDDLTTMTFEYNDTIVGIFTEDGEDLSLDLDITGIGMLSSPLSTTTATDGSVSMSATYMGNPYVLDLDLDNITVVYVSPVSAAVMATATVTSQDLPFDLEITDLDGVTFSYVGDLRTVTLGGNDVVTGFTASGAGVQAAQGVPEPSTLALAAFGLIGLMGLVWRRRRTA